MVCVALWAFCGLLRGHKESRPALSPGGYAVKYGFVRLLSFPPLHPLGYGFGRCHGYFDKLAALRREVVPETVAGQRFRSFGVDDVSGVLSGRTP